MAAAAAAGTRGLRRDWCCWVGQGASRRGRGSGRLAGSPESGCEMGRGEVGAARWRTVTGWRVWMRMMSSVS